MELRRYLLLIWKWAWLIALSVLLAASSSYIASKRITPVYKTQTTLLIGKALKNPSPNYDSIYIGQELALTYIQLATREPVLKGAMDSLGLKGDWRMLQGQVNASAITNTQLIEISVVDSNPRRAKALADAVAQQMIALSSSSVQGKDPQQQQFIRDQLNDLQTKIQDAKKESADLQTQRDASISARQIQDLNNQIDVLESKISGWQNTYSQLLLSVEGGDVNAMSIVEEAPVPDWPISPNTKMNVLTAAAIGLALAVGGALLLEYLDDTVKEPDDVTRLTGLSTLGIIGKTGGKTYPEKLVAAREPRSPVVEAYRKLRVNLQFAAVDTPLHTLLVTSPGPGEGKSTIAANLAVVMAQAGLKVVLVDADMRRPTQHRVFELENEKGLSSAMLQPDAPISAFMQPTALENLRVLTSGPLMPRPAEFMGSERMLKVIGELKDLADMVIFDTPPLMAVADATVLAVRVDGMIIVNEAGQTRSEHLKSAVEDLKRTPCSLLGVVINQVKAGRGSYYYYYYYNEDGKRVSRKQKHKENEILPVPSRANGNHNGHQRLNGKVLEGTVEVETAKRREDAGR